jgi:hypothetical protein
MDLGERHLRFGTGNVVILYIKQLTDRKALAEQVIKPLLQHDRSQSLSASEAVESVMFADDCIISSDTSQSSVTFWTA